MIVVRYFFLLLLNKIHTPFCHFCMYEYFKSSNIASLCWFVCARYPLLLLCRSQSSAEWAGMERRRGGKLVQPPPPPPPLPPLPPLLIVWPQSRPWLSDWLDWMYRLYRDDLSGVPLIPLVTMTCKITALEVARKRSFTLPRQNCLLKPCYFSFGEQHHTK